MVPKNSPINPCMSKHQPFYIISKLYAFSIYNANTLIMHFIVFIVLTVQ